MSPIVTLTTDFGLSDGYVASMKGVILSLSPQAIIVDITHDVPAQDILHGAFVLSAACAFFPAGTVHVVVVDPGVGAGRRALGLSWRGHYFVGPDNGVLSLVLGDSLRRDPGRGGIVAPYDGPLPAGAVCHELTERRYHLPKVSSTFHGRDLFAPVAAHLSLGVRLRRMGPRVTAVRYLGVAAPQMLKDGIMRGAIIHIDRFGNAVTNLRRDHVGETEAEIRVGRTVVHRLSRSYQDGDEVLALWGSSGYLEIAVRDGSAARRLRLKPGQAVTVRPTGSHVSIAPSP